MRIVSQDKMTDTPYEGAVVYINRNMNNHIYIGNIGDEVGFPIGIYNSKEDAIYVMSLIRTAFAYENQYFYMPKAEDASIIKLKMKDGEQE